MKAFILGLLFGAEILTEDAWSIVGISRSVVSVGGHEARGLNWRAGTFDGGDGVLQFSGPCPTEEEEREEESDKCDKCYSSCFLNSNFLFVFDDHTLNCSIVSIKMSISLSIVMILTIIGRLCAAKNALDDFHRERFR